MKIAKLTIGLYLRHITGIFLSFLLAFPLVGMLENPYWFGSITTLLLLALIYSGGWNAGYRDARKIPGFYPDKTLPIKSACWFFVIPLMLYVLRLFFPEILPSDLPVADGSYQFFLKGNFAYGTPDFLYKLWYFPFNAFMGNGNLVLYAIMLFIEPLVSILGYHIGLTRFSVLGFLQQKIVYTNKKTKE